MEKSLKIIEIEFDNEPVYGDNDKHIKTKIKIYAGSMITNFHSKKIPKEKAPYKCLSIIMLDSEKIKMENLMDDDLEKVHLMSLIMTLMMKQNLIMMNLTNSLLKAKRVF